MGGNQLAVPGRFVVVGELRRPWPRCGANLGDGLVARDPAQRRGVSRPPRKIVAIRRPQRVAPQRVLDVGQQQLLVLRSEEHTSELQSLMRISYAVFCLKK